VLGISFIGHWGIAPSAIVELFLIWLLVGAICGPLFGAFIHEEELPSPDESRRDETLSTHQGGE
jgi:hypothetical protein